MIKSTADIKMSIELDHVTRKCSNFQHRLGKINNIDVQDIFLKMLHSQNLDFWDHEIMFIKFVSFLDQLIQ